MALFRRVRDDGEGEWVPTDDAADFVLTERQQHIRRTAETRRQMSKLWDVIQERWRNPWRQP